MHPHSLLPSTKGAEKKEHDLMLNIGLWGDGPASKEEALVKNRALEVKLRELGGMKWLYAHTYYDEKDFWGQFNRQWYEDLRKKYNATGLMSVWEKVYVDVEAETSREKQKGLWERLKTVWPIGGFYGIRKAILSKTYLAARASTWKQFGTEVARR